ncbi:hypothetical protein B0E46_14285 [Rhodanobacter sp. B04]|uniref:hypothetical protein n=1 Tax=Rhodanobacter sp. B04 TaxID=1945860 RepID=UPI000984983E|nr:hypothetical protein [Rhodanobacter sp. B04]OOG61857.1 hypothetical protein B0E46_14285 [Rhodanobacter sp. B04]
MSACLFRKKCLSPDAFKKPGHDIMQAMTECEEPRQLSELTRIDDAHLGDEHNGDNAKPRSQVDQQTANSS